MTKAILIPLTIITAGGLSGLLIVALPVAAALSVWMGLRARDAGCTRDCNQGRNCSCMKGGQN